MATNKQKFASQANPELLEALKAIAQEEGRQLQAVMEDAFRFYIEQRQNETPRNAVMGHFRASLKKNRRLGELLAQ